MTLSFLRSVCLLCVAAAGVSPAAAEHWQMQYFYDKAKSTFLINDFQFASATRGVAVGVIQDRNRQRPVALVTSDGGAHWEFVDLKEEPVSLFFLNENFGWLVTVKGVWQTAEAGKSWRKLPRPPAPVSRVYFSDEKNGWATGEKKTVLETHDGGQKWTPLAAAAQPPGDPKYSAYSWIAFASPQLGIITGWNMPPQRTFQLPDWMDPQTAINHREGPHLSLSLQTADGGKTWNGSSGSTFGMITRMRFNPKGFGLGLVEYSEAFQYPSEVYQITWPGGRSRSVYREKKFAVTDLWVQPNGTAYLAGPVNRGELHSVVPGKIQVLQSQDYATWNEIEVDYRAVANRVLLASAGGQMWLATDAGMLLKLVP